MPWHLKNSVQHCWPREKQLIVGKKYTYKGYTCNNKAPTKYPHKNEDLVANLQPSSEIIHPTKRLYDNLKPVAKTSIIELFGAKNLIDASYGSEHVPGRCCVKEDTDCPSVGIIKTKIRNLEFIESGTLLKKNTRLKIIEKNGEDFS